MRLYGATALLALASCAPYLGNGEGYEGSLDEMTRLAVAARQCGVRNLRVGTEGRVATEGAEARLFLSHPPFQSRKGVCLSQWIKANMPDVGFVVVAD